MDEQKLEMIFNALKMSVGEALRVARVHACKTQKKLAKKIKKTSAWTMATEESQIERQILEVEIGKLEVSFVIFEEICLALGSGSEKVLRIAYFIFDQTTNLGTYFLEGILNQAEYDAWLKG